MKKRYKKSKWLSVPEIPAEIRINGDYFEIRGRIPSRPNSVKYFQIIEKWLSTAVWSMAKREEKPFRDVSQGELNFKKNIEWKQIPLLGKKTLKTQSVETERPYRDAV